VTRWTFDEQQQTGELKVSGAVTVSQVAEIRKLLLKALDQAPLVRLDLGQVEAIDIAGLQLFCAAHRLADRTGRCLAIVALGEPVLKLVHEAGFAHLPVCDQDRQSACFWARRT